MFDESGWDIPQGTGPKKHNSQPQPSQPLPQPQPRIIETRRPLWLHLTVFILGLSLTTRFCALPDVANIGTFVIQFGTVIVTGITILGLVGLRRWAVWLLILFCGWSILHAVIVGIARILQIDNEIEGITLRDQLMLGEIFNMFMAAAIYGTMGVWFFIKRAIFIPTRASRYGNIPYVILMSIMILFTATQVVDAPRHLRLQEDALKESQDVVRGWFGQ